MKPGVALTCGRRGCDKPGKWHPVLVLYALPGTPPARGTLGVRVCDEHRALGPEEWITDEGWATIVAGITGTGRMAPDRALTEVEYVEAPVLQ